MENNPKLRLESKDTNNNESKDKMHYKLLVQDAFNEFSGVSRIIDLKALNDEDFWSKVQSYNLKKFDEYHTERGVEVDTDGVDENYPGFIARFNRLVEKIRNSDISREELSLELKSLYEETTESITA